MSEADLFGPVRLFGMDLANRVVMAPMTRSRAGPGAVPGPHTAEYYAQRASAGLIVTEAIGVNAQAIGYPRTPGIYSAEQIAGWRRVADAVHRRGGRIAAQLWHVGRIFAQVNNPEGLEPLAPSAVAAEGRIFTFDGLIPLPVPQAMTTAQVARTVADFAQAARTCFDAGFDAVEIHAANGYLIEQFMSDEANRRADRYGGSLDRRLRFLAEVLDAVAAQCGGLERVAVRLSPFGVFNGIRHGNPAALFDASMDLLAQKQVGCVHLIGLEVSGAGDSKSAQQGDVPDVLAIARARYAGPLMAAGGYDRASAEQTLAEGRADLIAFGRPFISNPDLVERMRQGLPLAEWNRRSFYTPGPEGYIDYPVAASVTDT